MLPFASLLGSQYLGVSMGVVLILPSSVVLRSSFHPETDRLWVWSQQGSNKCCKNGNKCLPAGHSEFRGEPAKFCWVHKVQWSHGRGSTQDWQGLGSIFSQLQPKTLVLIYTASLLGSKYSGLEFSDKISRRLLDVVALLTMTPTVDDGQIWRKW